MAIDFAKLQENAKKVTDNGLKKNNNQERDTRFYETQRDKKTGNFNAVIRFLHSDEKNEMPFVKRINHKNEEKVGDKTYNLYQQCPTEIGEKCPICEYNRDHWDEYSVVQQGRKRKTRFYTNILVVSDPAHPENEGKVFLFSYGIKIQEMIMKKIAPDTVKNPKAKPVNIFDYVKGRNFFLNIKTEAGYANYNDSEWDEDSSEIENMDDQIISMEEFVPKKENFKSYDELKQKFDRFLNLVEKKNRTSSTSVKENSKEDVWEEETQTSEKEKSSNVIDKKTTTEDDFFDFDKED